MVKRLLKVLTVLCITIGVFFSGNSVVLAERSKGISFTEGAIFVTVSDGKTLINDKSYYLSVTDEHGQNQLNFDYPVVDANNGTVAFDKSQLEWNYANSSPVTIDLYQFVENDADILIEENLSNGSIVLPPMGTGRSDLSGSTTQDPENPTHFTVSSVSLPAGKGDPDGFLLFIWNANGTKQVLNLNNYSFANNTLNFDIKKAQRQYGDNYVNGTYRMDLVLDYYGDGGGQYPCALGEYTVNTEPPAPINAGSIASNDDGAGRAFLINGVNGQDGNPVLTAGPYDITISGTDQNNQPVEKTFTTGINEVHGEAAGKFIFAINNSSLPDGFKATITSIIMVKKGSEQRYALTVPAGGILFHKFNDPVNEGNCVLEFTGSDTESFTFKMKCYGSDGTTNVVKDGSVFNDRSIYTLELKKADKPEEQTSKRTIMLSAGHIDGEYFSLTRADVDPQTIYIENGTYLVTLRVQELGTGGTKDLYYGHFKDPTKTEDEAYKIDLKNVNDEPAELSVTETEDALTISCAAQTTPASCDAYLRELWKNEGPTQDSSFSQIRFTHVPMISGKPFVTVSDYHEYDENGEMIKNLVPNVDPDSENPITTLTISRTILNKIGIEKNEGTSYYDIDVDIPGGYARSSINNFVSQYGLDTDDNNVYMNQAEPTEENPKPKMVFSYDGSSEAASAYFNTVARMTFNVGEGATTEIILKPKQGWNAEITSDGKLILDAETVVADISPNVSINIYSNKYGIKTLRGQKVTYCILFQPTDLTTRITTDGVVITTENEAYLRNLKKVEFHINKSDKTSGQQDFIAMGKESYDEGSKKILIPLTKTQLDEFNADTSIDNEYWSFAKADGYASYANENTLSLNPIIFAGNVNSVKDTWNKGKGENPDVNVLADIDDVATKLDNGYTVTAPEMTSSGGASNLGIDLVGAIGGAIVTDNTSGETNYDVINNSTTEVSVTRDASTISANVDTMITETGLSGAIKTDVNFDLSIKKDGNEIIQLPYGAMIRFRMPEGYSGTYYLLTQHKDFEGKVSYKKLDVTVVDGFGIAYTDQFSSFALVNAGTTPTPVPSKKESSSGSSISKKDNVVTCQMAGYPANYAWNESVKACQPGYIDNNGVFHLTAGNTNKRVGVVNTSDNGIAGMIAGLASSTIVAIAAAYLLKKYN